MLTAKTSLLPNDSSRPLFKQIEIYSGILTTYSNCKILPFIYARATRITGRQMKRKLLLPNERVASVYCRTYYELHLSNSRAIVLQASLRTADVSPRSSPLRDVSRGGTSSTQRQKFHTDDVNQCLLNKSGGHGVPNAIFFQFTFLLVDFGKVMCSSENELQQNSNSSSREDYITQILTVLLEIHLVYI